MAGEFYSERNSDFVHELRRGFENLGRDIRGALLTTNAGVERLSGDIKYGAGITRDAGRTFSQGAGRKIFNFMGETFSKEFNKPALWSRDLTYMMGKDPRDMTKGQAQYYAREHWNQRFKQFGSFAAKDIAPLAMLAGRGPGMVASLGYEAFVSPHITDQKALYKWKNYLDQSSQSYVLAGASENRVTGRGWSEQQLESIGRFHLQYEKGNKYFKEDEQFAIEQLATTQGYYQKTTSMAQYKRKYKELIEGTKEVMKTLHTSMEEAVGVMSEVSRMKITNQKGFIKGVGMASAFSGLSSEQVMRYAGAFGSGMDKRGFAPGYGAQVGLELLKQPAKDFMGLTLDRYTKKSELMAGFYTPEGKWNADVYNRLKAGKISFREIANLGIQNTAGYLEAGTMGTFNLNRERIMSENIPANEMPRLGVMLDYARHKALYEGTGYGGMDDYLAEKKRQGFSDQALKDIRKELTDPLGGRKYSEYADFGMMKGRGSIFSRAGTYIKASWDRGIPKKISGTVGDYIGRRGLLSEGYEEIEERGRLDEKYLIAKRIQKDFRLGGAGYKEVGRWLGADLSSGAFERFQLEEFKAGTGTIWSRGAFKANAVKEEMDRYNELVMYAHEGKRMKSDAAETQLIRTKINKTLGDYKFRPGDVGWYKKLKPIGEEYGFSPEYFNALRDVIRGRMPDYREMNLFAYPTTGLTAEERKAIPGKEKEIWLQMESFDRGKEAGKAIQGLSIWGKYRSGEFKGDTEELIKQAKIELTLKKADITKSLTPTDISNVIRSAVEQYERGDTPLIDRIREKSGTFGAGDMDVEAIMSAILGSGAGSVSAEALRTVADALYILKDSIEHMNKKITGDSPTPLAAPSVL